MPDLRFLKGIETMPEVIHHLLVAWERDKRVFRLLLGQPEAASKEARKCKASLGRELRPRVDHPFRKGDSRFEGG
jgi:hypothetical protein